MQIGQRAEVIQIKEPWRFVAIVKLKQHFTDVETEIQRNFFSKVPS